jgi:hypothetical protein
MLAPPRRTADRSVLGSHTTDRSRSDRPKFLNMFKTIGSVRWSADRSVGPCPTDVNRETDSPRTGPFDVNRALYNFLAVSLIRPGTQGMRSLLLSWLLLFIILQLCRHKRQI